MAVIALKGFWLVQLAPLENKKLRVLPPYVKDFPCAYKMQRMTTVSSANVVLETKAGLLEGLEWMY